MNSLFRSPLLILLLLIGCTSLGAVSLPSDEVAANAPATVDSREYKILLKTDLFEDRSAGIKNLWNRLREATGDAGHSMDEKPGKEKRRRVHYLDSPNHDLRERHGLVVRSRRYYKKGSDGKAGAFKKSKKITVKLRAESLAEATRMLITTSDTDQDHKVEADILPGGLVKYSQSGSIKVDDKEKIETTGDLEKLFPFLQRLDLPPILKVVNDRSPLEIIREGELVMDGKELEVSITLWYMADNAALPAAAELSFVLEKPKKSTTIAADEMFEQIVVALKESRATTTRTKTSLIYTP